jgi:hypothetical protein
LHNDEEQNVRNDTQSLKTLQKSLSSITNGKPEILQVNFKPQDGLHEALSAPVTEVAMFRFDGSPPPDGHQNVEKAANALTESGATLHGWSYGIIHRALEKDGLKGKAALLIVGW